MFIFTSVINRNDSAYLLPYVSCTRRYQQGEEKDSDNEIKI
jgi:hypothetical protein